MKEWQDLVRAREEALAARAAAAALAEEHRLAEGAFARAMVRQLRDFDGVPTERGTLMTYSRERGKDGAAATLVRLCETWRGNDPRVAVNEIEVRWECGILADPVTGTITLVVDGDPIDPEGALDMAAIVIGHYAVEL